MDSQRDNGFFLIPSYGILYLLLVVQLTISSYLARLSGRQIFILLIVLGFIYLLSFIMTFLVKAFDVFNHFWATFSLGGIGMFIGGQIDQYRLMAHVSHIGEHSVNVFSFSHLFFNWMTLVMIIFCVPVCVFFTSCRLTRPIRYGLHSIVIIFMLIGMAVGHIIAMLLTNNSLIIYYSAVIGMSLCATTSYYFFRQLLHYYFMNNIHYKGESL